MSQIKGGISMSKRYVRPFMATVALSMIAAGGGLWFGPEQALAASSKTPITIALISSLTGEAGPQFADSPQGFLARIDLQNAEGGVDGHMLKPLILDDQTNPTQVVTATNDAISQGAFGIVSVSPLFFLAAKAPNQQGVPVTGGTFDGPEWGTPPYSTNMFASDTGSVDPKYPVSTAIGSFLKSHGGNVIASYGYSISPSSTRSAIGTVDSFEHAGGKLGVLDTSVPFGGVDFTTAALLAKQKHVDAVYAGMDDNSNYALATAFDNAGIKAKAIVFPTGYDPTTITSPAWHYLQGDYFGTGFRPTSIPDAGTEQLVSALQKYQHRPASKFPTFNIYESWLGADLMIKGLELAGPNPTRAGVMHALRNLKSYNGNGILPQSIDYATAFGHDLPKACEWYLKAEAHSFVPVSTQPICGHDIPGTSTAS
jgi:branched-chain amino acid transport system substrate-binding protein